MLFLHTLVANDLNSLILLHDLILAYNNALSNSIFFVQYWFAFEDKVMKALAKVATKEKIEAEGVLYKPSYT